MDESAPIRAIVIGASLLIAIATISAVLMYYNTARQMASNVGRGQDFAANYEKGIQDILMRGSYTVSGNNYITGTDVKNLLNYFYNDDTVNISVENVRYIDIYDSNRPTTSVHYDNKSGKDDYNWLMKNILLEQKFTITKTEEDNILKLNIKGILN